MVTRLGRLWTKKEQILCFQGLWKSMIIDFWDFVNVITPFQIFFHDNLLSPVVRGFGVFFEGAETAMLTG